MLLSLDGDGGIENQRFLEHTRPSDDDLGKVRIWKALFMVARDKGRLGAGTLSSFEYVWWLVVASLRSRFLSQRESYRLPEKRVLGMEIWGFKGLKESFRRRGHRPSTKLGQQRVQILRHQRHGKQDTTKY